MQQDQTFETLLSDAEIDAVAGASPFLPVEDDGLGRPKYPDFIWT